MIWNTNYTEFELNYSELKGKIKLTAKYYQTETNYEQKWTKWTERSTGTEILTLFWAATVQDIRSKRYSIDRLFYQADATSIDRQSIDRIYFWLIDSSGYPESCRNCRTYLGETKTKFRTPHRSSNNRKMKQKSI